MPRMTSKDFVQQLYPIAKGICLPRGISPAGALIQASWESDWGKTGAIGVWFGIKGWRKNRPTTAQPTFEVVNGQRVNVTAGFEKSDLDGDGKVTFGEACQDYCDFLLAGPRYKPALMYRDDWRRFVRTVARCGYATDPKYEDHLLARGEVIEKLIYHLGLEG